MNLFGQQFQGTLLADGLGSDVVKLCGVDGLHPVKLLDVVVSEKQKQIYVSS